MHPRTTTLLSLLLLASSAVFAQNAVLKLDSTSKKCAKESAGGMWIVHDTTVVNPSRPQMKTFTVTLTMTPTSGASSRQVVRFLTVGGSSDLGCSEGKDGATYQIVSVK